MVEYDQEMPGYVRRILDKQKAAKFIALRRMSELRHDRRQPILVCVVRDEVANLPEFLRHYRTVGIERFVFIDNASRDRSKEYLIEQPDVDLFYSSTKFDWYEKQAWINLVIKSYGYGRWYLVVDADELLVFDGCYERSLRDLVLVAEQREIRRVRGILVDMYQTGSDWTDASGRNNLFSTYKNFDGVGYVESPTPAMISVTGGVRARMLQDPNGEGSRPELTKYPLFHIREGEVAANPHHLWPYHENFRSPRLVAMLHFKLTPAFRRKVAVAVSEQNYWNGSSEYRAYAQWLDDASSFDLRASGTKRLGSVSDLISAGLIEEVNWTSSILSQDIMLSSYRRQRAQS